MDQSRSAISSSSKDKLYILHEYGEPGHYLGLRRLCEMRGVELAQREFSWLRGLAKGLLFRDRKKIVRAWQNLRFLFGLITGPSKRVLFSAAPFDWRLVFLYPILWRHRLFYHTSWSEWEGERYPKRGVLAAVAKRLWPRMLGRCERVYAVTQRAKESLCAFGGVDPNKVEVVGHAYDETIFFPQDKKRDIDFIYAGRLVPQKGIEEVLELFLGRSERLCVVGEGPLAPLAKEYGEQSPNIVYLPKLSKHELASLFRRSRFVVLNSKKSPRWEELFGMVLIEAMACGAVPVAVDHVGPREIVTDGCGVLFEEGRLQEALDAALRSDEKSMRQRAIERSKEFASGAVAQKWKGILG